jgi:hypothetical protein
MKCDFCGKVFEIDESRKGCSGCPMNKACKKVKCPNCNYEMVPVPEFKAFHTIKKWGKKLWQKE